MSDSVSSPCVNVCRIEPGSGLCAGCRRTLEEIANWGAYTEEERRAVIRALAGRETPVARAGGRS